MKLIICVLLLTAVASGLDQSHWSPLVQPQQQQQQPKEEPQPKEEQKVEQQQDEPSGKPSIEEEYLKYEKEEMKQEANAMPQTLDNKPQEQEPEDEEDEDNDSDEVKADNEAIEEDNDDDADDDEEDEFFHDEVQPYSPPTKPVPFSLLALDDDEDEVPEYEEDFSRPQEFSDLVADDDDDDDDEDLEDAANIDDEEKEKPVNLEELENEINRVDHDEGDEDDDEENDDELLQVLSTQPAVLEELERDEVDEEDEEDEGDGLEMAEKAEKETETETDQTAEPAEFQAAAKLLLKQEKILKPTHVECSADPARVVDMKPKTVFAFKAPYMLHSHDGKVSCGWKFVTSGKQMRLHCIYAKFPSTSTLTLTAEGKGGDLYQALFRGTGERNTISQVIDSNKVTIWYNAAKSSLYNGHACYIIAV